MDTIIVVSEARKHFGSTVALDGLSFSVTPGNVTGFGLLDRNPYQNAPSSAGP
ncbi:MAG: hypothetical protein QOH66_569 [Actinomycetota bacterium]|jgi:ABC-type uncharacterized transport system ATPase subunit|nr:hypothetical protein [Actinomycetota bacterium]MEA2587642.1 hypothetical protein [Actinomycetota bacterium]